jgi:hypothetical protein
VTDLTPVDQRRSGLNLHPAVMAVLAVCLVLALAGAGYLLGRASGEDLGDARSTGRAAGLNTGAVAGEKRGRQEGARDGFRVGYENGYRSAYEAAGLDAPKKVDVPRK